MYIAQKPCNFAGTDFLIGESIPDGMVDERKAAFLIKRGIIAEIEPVEAKDGIVRFDIPIHAEEGDLMVSLSAEEVVSIFDCLQGGTEEAKSVINTMENGEALLLLEVAEGRKGVKTAIKERCAVLFPNTEEEEAGAEGAE